MCGGFVKYLDRRAYAALCKPREEARWQPSRGGLCTGLASFARAG